MKYYIKRDANEYGPYTLADLQRYVAQGNIVLTDLARGEGMTAWVPVSQILSSMPAAPPPAQPAAAAAAAGYPVAAAQPVAMQPAPMQAGTMQPGAMQPGYPQTGVPYAAAPSQVVPGPIPPDFHWALVLVINFFCGIFRIVWLFIEAAFVKKIKPDSNFLLFLIIGKCVEFGSGILLYVGLMASALREGSEFMVAPVILGVLVWLAGFVLLYIGIFKMRDEIQQYYNTVEPINLRLSAVMTFFFPTFYFQHHFSRIAQWKKTGVLQPQG